MTSVLVCTMIWIVFVDFLLCVFSCWPPRTESRAERQTISRLRLSSMKPQDPAPWVVQRPKTGLPRLTVQPEFHHRREQKTYQVQKRNPAPSRFAPRRAMSAAAKSGVNQFGRPNTPWHDY